MDKVALPSIQDLLKLCWDKDPNVRPSFKEIVKMLEHILIDSAICDAEGRAFWKQYFPDKQYAPFTEFLPAFLEFSGLPEPEELYVDCLKLVLATQLTDNIMKPIDIVRIADFGNFLQNFGPIKITRERRNKQETFNIFQRMIGIVKQPWFHGDISREKAEFILRGYKSGYFLVRLSSTVSGCFTISRVTPNNTIHHHRIDYKLGRGYATRSVLDKKTIIADSKKSLHSFIQLLKPDMHLDSPCPGSKFRYLFKATVVQGGGGYYNQDSDEDMYVDL